MTGGARAKLLSLLVLGVVFASGLVVGVAWDRSRDDTSTSESRRDDRRGNEGDGERRERRPAMYERVGLNPDQKALVDTIVAGSRERMRSLQQEFQDEYNPRYWSVIEETRAAIRGVMDADQAIKYDSLLAEWDQRRRSDEDDRGR